MSIWGKLLAGTFGFALGGPIGALLGVIAGHSVDKIRKQTSGVDGNIQSPQEVITVGIIILAAKLSKADGQVTSEEISAFKEKFKIPPNFQSDVGKIFNEAKKTSEDYHQYAQQLGMIFRGQHQVLEQIINLLFFIAEADGEISKPEILFIEGCAKYFGLNKNQYDSIQTIWLDKQINPYKILGVEKDTTNEEIRKRWIQLSKELHPDQLRAQGVPQELIIKSEDRLSEINQAYDKIKILRNIN
jgi:DnaJ like chaperone protein